MKVKKVKKNLSFNKRTIRNLDIKVIVKDEQRVIKAGNDILVGVTEHPKYC